MDGSFNQTLLIKFIKITFRFLHELAFLPFSATTVLWSRRTERCPQPDSFMRVQTVILPVESFLLIQYFRHWQEQKFIAFLWPPQSFPSVKIVINGRAEAIPAANSMDKALQSAPSRSLDLSGINVFIDYLPDTQHNIYDRKNYFRDDKIFDKKCAFVVSVWLASAVVCHENKY